MTKNKKKLLVRTISFVALVFGFALTITTQGCGDTSSTAAYTLRGAPR